MKIYNPSEKEIRIVALDGFSVRVKPRCEREISENRFAVCAAGGLIESPLGAEPEPTVDFEVDGGYVSDAVIADCAIKDTPHPLTQHTVKELKAMCKARGFSGYSKLTEAELIKMLEG